MWTLPSFIQCLQKLSCCRKSRNSLRSHPEDDCHEATPQSCTPVPEDYPTFPPPPPNQILRDPGHYWARVSARKYGAPQGVFEDSPLYALYRLYEAILLDKVFAYRNMLEWFWRQSKWPVCDIPDPQDDDPARYAFLAGITFLMVRSYNARVAIGLVRGAPAIMTMEEAEEAKRCPEHDRPYERVPQWAEKVPPLPELLSIPTHEGLMLDGKEDTRADRDFLAKNILLWTPHIHFT